MKRSRNKGGIASADAGIPFRIRIGVTGHRLLKNPEAVTRRMQELLSGGIRPLLEPPSPDTENRTSFSYTVVSSLAEGADRLLAEEFLKTENSELEAVLPLAKEDYQRDFSTPESKAEFFGLLRRDRKTTVLRETGPESKLKNFREKAYEAAGRYVVDHCDLLIAVWDGEPARGRGGTAEIVAYARLKGRPLVIVPMDKNGAVRIEKGCGISVRDTGNHAK